MVCSKNIKGAGMAGTEWAREEQYIRSEELMEKPNTEGPKYHIEVSEKEQTLEDNRNNIIWLQF